MFVLGLTILYVVVTVACFALLAPSMPAPGSSPYGEPVVAPSPFTGIPFMILGLAALALIIPSIAVQVRRFHDQDKSGWMVLLGFIPAIGGIIVLVFMCLEGTRGPNRFGPDPKAESVEGETY